MGERKTVFVIPARKLTDMLWRKMSRICGSHRFPTEMSKLIDRFWDSMSTFYDKDCDITIRLQAWQYYRAYCHTLRHFGWWDYENNMPKDYGENYHVD